MLFSSITTKYLCIDFKFMLISITIFPHIGYILARGSEHRHDSMILKLMQACEGATSGEAAYCTKEKDDVELVESFL